MAGGALPAWGGGRDNPYRLTINPGDYRLRLPVDLGAGPSRGGERARFSDLIDRHARARGLDPALVDAVVRAESGYRPEAVSPKGAVGLMQIMPDTGRRFGARDLESPEDNLRAGTAYLGYLLGRFGDLSLALAAYNAGEGAVLRYGNRIPPYPETRAYVQAILGRDGGGRATYLYLPGTRLDRHDLSPYRLNRFGGDFLAESRER